MERSKIGRAAAVNNKQAYPEREEVGREVGKNDRVFSKQKNRKIDIKNRDKDLNWQKRLIKSIFI